MVLIYSLIVFWFHSRSTLVTIDNNPHLKYCSSNDIPIYLTYSAASADIFISYLCLYLFVKPLKVLLKQMHTESLQNIVLKYSINTAVTTITTTLVMIFMAMFHMGYLILVDFMMQTVCVALMNQMLDKAYHWLCCGAIYFAHAVWHPVVQSMVNISSHIKSISRTSMNSPVMSAGNSESQLDVNHFLSSRNHFEMTSITCGDSFDSKEVQVLTKI